MSDKLRAAAQEALDLLSEDDRNADKCIRILEAALAEPAIKESLTVRPWIGLTENEIWTLHDFDSYPSPVEFARAIEAKLRERNGG